MQEVETSSVGTSALEPTPSADPLEMPNPESGDGHTYLDRVLSWWPEAVVTLGSLLIFSWQLDRNGLGNQFYAAAVRSMSLNWHNFVFGAYDPGAWSTTDKPPLSLWSGAGLARTFGFSSWAVLLPSVLAAGLAVWLLMSTVRRPWGRSAGLVSGVVFALTPIVVAMSRSNNPDMVLVCCCVAAAWAVGRGIADGRTRWMLLAGLFCAAGFLSKLLAVGMVMPGLWLAYLIAAPGPWGRRVVQCLYGGLLFIAVGAAWIVGIDLVPLSQRPWIGTTTDGSALNLVFGSSGFNRLAGTSTVRQSQINALAKLISPINQLGGDPGILRLFNTGIGDQIMWLFPVAAVSAVGGGIMSWKRRVRDARLGSLVAWVGWAVVTYLVLAFAQGVFHNYYVVLLAPALAALCGIGLTLAREAGVLGRLVAAAALLIGVAWEVVLLDRVSAWQWLRFALPVVIVVVAVICIVGSFGSRTGGRVTLVALLFGGAVLVVPPALWSSYGVRSPQIGGLPQARPASSSGEHGSAGSSSPPIAMLNWLRLRRGGASWEVAVPSSFSANVPIIDGYSVVALGGYLGTDASASMARVTEAVRDGSLRYFYLGEEGFGAGGAEIAKLTADVASSCTQVDPSEWGAPSTSSPATGSGTLYDCAGKAAALQHAASEKQLPSPAASSATSGTARLKALLSGNGIRAVTIRKCLAQQGVIVNVDGQTQEFSKLRQALLTCTRTLGGHRPSPSGSP